MFDIYTHKKFTDSLYIVVYESAQGFLYKHLSDVENEELLKLLSKTKTVMLKDKNLLWCDRVDFLENRSFLCKIGEQQC